MSLWGSPVDLPITPPRGPPSITSEPTTPSLGSPRPAVATPLAGPNSEVPVPRLDGLFNFQIVVFQVEDTLFQVLKNGFMVPGTPFEAMFALPVPAENVEQPLAEGDSLTNPIVLSGVSTNEFRAFLRILYPFIGPSVVASYDDWVGILNLATMWEFKHIREQAISKLSSLIKEKPVPERVMLGRKYCVKDWLKEEYVTLAQKTDLKLENLRDPSNIKLDWETIAKIQSVREKNMLNNLRDGRLSSGYHCGSCNVYYGYSYEILDCRCRLPALVDEVFQEEFREMAISVGDFPNLPPLPVTGR
ncbi:hypothetical protein CVT25_002791 [Psilocybe cyanescens]|uniref:BTB domain-containing protein n=1 Tax=Psilocybe cyanescens TaxID=93625 RepID=A0A409WKT8_PSICY|nr:hypothetical protein CVT25_002791 [Psilocybe cyanescens]